MLNTLVVDLIDDIKEINEIINENDHRETIFDFSLKNDTRIRALELYYEINRDNSIEVINKITGIYQFSGSKILEKYLIDICKNSNLSSFLKLECAKSLQIFDEDKNLGYEVLNMVCENMIDIPTPCKINAIFLLMKSNTFIDNALNYFNRVINNPLLECDYRYGIILSLENQDIKNKIYYITESCKSFLNNIYNMTLYRILSSQYLLRDKNVLEETKQIVQDILLSFCNDNTLDYNLRADSADTLLRYGSEERKLIARDIIILLGRNNVEIRTIFSNSQNVHIEEIEKSILEIIEYLNTLPVLLIDSNDITFDYISKKLEKDIEKREENDSDKIKISLNRINIDRTLYSKYNCSLNSIFIKVYSYIYSHESKDIMINRLLEELIDMHGTCSTGFVSRLINTISGFGDISIRISFEDQIISNVFGRLNAKIRELNDEDMKEKIIEEMSLTNSSMLNRKHFYKFFRDYIPSLKEELYKEFNAFITDTDFDLYMRKAIMVYETGEKFV